MSKLYFRYGAMESGKSTSLLQVVHNYKDKDKTVFLLKPQIDTKGDRHVVSRIGIQSDVDALVAEDQSIFDILMSLSNTNFEKIDAVIIDEAQFLTPDQIDQLYYMTKQYDIPILCYGLRCDFQMKGFPGATRLLEIADSIEELKTICKCGSKATQNMRYLNGIPTFNGDQVAIDGENKVTYESVCGKCYILTKEKYQNKK